MSIIKHLKRI